MYRDGVSITLLSRNQEPGLATSVGSALSTLEALRSEDIPGEVVRLTRGR